MAVRFYKIALSITILLTILCISVMSYLAGKRKMALNDSSIIEALCNDVEWATPTCQKLSDKAGEIINER